MTTFGSNILSLRAQRHLNVATYELSSSFSKLSSGLRITSASDDAAGLSISSRLRTDSRLYATASRNVNDGISALNIMSSTLGNQTSILTRLMELAEQSANGTFSNTQRSSISAEYRSLVSEFGRLGDTTRFNGLDLLLKNEGSGISSLLLQAGITGDGNSLINLSTTNTGTFSGNFHFSNYGSDIAVGEQTIDQITLTDAPLIRTTIRDNQNRTHDALIQIFADSSTTLSFSLYIKAEETDGAVSSTPGKWVNLSVLTLGNPLPTISNGRVVGNYTGTATGLAGGATASFDFNFSGFTVSGNESMGLPTGVNNTSIEASGVETATQSLAAMSILRDRLEQLSNFMGQIGGVESRLRTTGALLLTSRENVTAAESRITDLDVAEETSKLVANQIRQQAGTQVLSLANSQPQILLGLLKI